MRPAGVLELTGVDKAELLHDPPGRGVVTARERDDATDLPRRCFVHGAAAELGGDALTPVVTGHRPADLDLAAPGGDRVLDEAPADAAVALPGQRPAETVRGPVRDGPRHHRLAVGERERSVVAGASQPRGDRGIAQQVVEGGRIAGGDRSQVEHAGQPSDRAGNETAAAALASLANM